MKAKSVLLHSYLQPTLSLVFSYQAFFVGKFSKQEDLYNDGIRKSSPIQAYM